MWKYMIETIAAVNQVRYSYGGIYLYTYDFNARRSTGTNAAGYDVVCSVVDGRLSIGETLTPAVPAGKYVLTANLLSGEENLALLRALAVGDTLTVTVRAADEGWNDVDYMIGALYQLVENGEVCKGLEAGAAPRTAIGQKADGSLVPRGAPGAMIEDEDTAIARVLQMAAQGTVQADDGSTVTLQADSVCVHGDGPKALAFVQKISAALLAAGTAVAAF